MSNTVDTENQKEKESLLFLKSKLPKAPALQKGDTELSSYRRLTHIYLDGMRLDKIGNLCICNNAKVLYLHNNNIERIENLECLPMLTHLYLQRNNLSKIENLSSLRHLRKLYLGHNFISVVEGLENCGRLQELHIEMQQLQPGESLCFEPRTIATLADSLQNINIVGNGMTSLAELAPLKYLSSINASANRLNDSEDLCQTVANWKFLREANFRGNAVTTHRRYRENLIACTDLMDTLDGKAITPISRRFIKNLELEKKMQNRAIDENMAQSIAALNVGVSPFVEKIVSKAMRRTKSTTSHFSRSILTTPITAVEGEHYLPWRAMKNKSWTSVPPLFYKQDTMRKSRVHKEPEGPVFPNLQ